MGQHKDYKRTAEHQRKLNESRIRNKEKWGGKPRTRAEELDLPSPDPDYPPNCGRRILSKPRCE